MAVGGKITVRPKRAACEQSMRIEPANQPTLPLPPPVSESVTDQLPSKSAPLLTQQEASETGLREHIFGRRPANHFRRLFTLTRTEEPTMPEEVIAQLRSPARTIIAWSRWESSKVGWAVFWKDYRDNVNLMGHGLEADRLMARVSVAANRAITVGGWASTLDLELKMYPPELAFIRRKFKGRQGPLVIPIGSVTALVGVEVLCELLLCSAPVITDWLKKLGVPLVPAPNRTVYFSLWIFELMLLSKSLGISLKESAELLKVAHTVQGALNQHKAMDRLSEIAGAIHMTKRRLSRTVKPHTQAHEMTTDQALD